MKEKINSFISSVPFLSKGNDTDFHSHGILTLGAEIELQIIDPESFKLAPKAEELLKGSAELSKNITKEFYLSTIEINSNKCNDVHGIEKDLSKSCDIVSKIAGVEGVKLASTGCHPISRYSDCIVTKSDRYEDLIDRNQWLTRRMMVYGLHVHLGMKTGDDVIRFNNFFLNFIPHLIALSASSPFWQGDDTGLAACRPTTYESLPTAGHPYRVNNWKEFERLYETLKKCKAINSLKDLWWDIRPSPHYGTLEVRACDGLATLEETLALVSFIHLLANWFNDYGSWLNEVTSPPLWFVRENKWRAIRYGLNADIVTNFDGDSRPISEDILQWLDKFAVYEKRLGYQKHVKTLKEIIEKGNSSNRQRKIYDKTSSLDDVVKFNIEEFEQRKPIWT